MKDSHFLLATVWVILITATIAKAEFGPVLISASIFSCTYYIVKQLEKQK